MGTEASAMQSDPDPGANFTAGTRGYTGACRACWLPACALLSPLRPSRQLIKSPSEFTHAKPHRRSPFSVHLYSELTPLLLLGRLLTCADGCRRYVLAFYGAILGLKTGDRNACAGQSGRGRDGAAGWGRGNRWMDAASSGTTGPIPVLLEQRSADRAGPVGFS